MRRTVLFGLIAVGAAALLGAPGCSDERNPYKDTSRSDVRIVCYGNAADTLIDGDTIEIFATDTMYVELTLQTHISGFRFSAAGNRLIPLSDTTISRSTFAGGALPWRFAFPVSFYDTGWVVVRVAAGIDNADSVRDSLRIYRVSPLDQADISAQPGQTVVFSTRPVQDYALYVWQIGSDSSTVNDAPTTARVMSEDRFVKGLLWVRAGQYRSPADSFQLLMGDTVPPAVVCLGDSLSDDSMHVYTGNIPFYLQVRVTDAGGAIVSAGLVGGEFDEIDTITSREWLCTQGILWLPAFGDSLPVLVEARDQSDNFAYDTIWVHYDSSLVTKPIVRILDPPVDFAQVPGSTVTVSGDIGNIAGYDTLVLVCYVNDDTASGARFISAALPSWSWRVILNSPNDTNWVGFALYDLNYGPSDTTYELLHIAYRAIVVDPGMPDATPPVIAHILDSSAGEIRDGYVSQVSPIDVAAQVYDLSGIDTVLMNGIRAALYSADLGLYAATVPIGHVRDGVELRVYARDSYGNTASAVRKVYRNVAPRIVSMPKGTYAQSGRVYRDSVSVYDSDNDTAQVSVLVQARTGNKVIAADTRGAFSWTPQSGDTGLTQIQVQASDGYPQGTAQQSYNVLVTVPADTWPTAHFTIDASAFVDTLVVGRDTLRVLLAIDQPLTAGSYLFSVRAVEGNSYLMQNSTQNQLVWVPSSSNIGLWTIEAVVASGPGRADTILPMPRVRIVPPPAPLEVSFGAQQSTATEPVSAFDLPVVLSRRAEQQVTVGYQVNWASSTVDSSDFSFESPSALTFAAGDSVKVLSVRIVDDAKVESEERLTIGLRDPLPSGALQIRSPSTHTIYIADNDTVQTYDTLWVANADSSGHEGVYTINVRISLRSPATKDIAGRIKVSGSALHGSDYSVSLADFVIAQGATSHTVPVQIINDTICERTPELAVFTLESGTPKVVISDNTFQYTIQPSIENCPAAVAFLHGESSLNTLEKAMTDSMRATGLDVFTMAVSQGGTMPRLDAFNLIVVSHTVKFSSVGTSYRTVAVPVLCLSMQNLYSLGLARTQSDTGRSAGSSIDLRASDFGSAGAVRITEGVSMIPWARATRTPTFIATVPGGQYGDTLSAIYRYVPGNIPGMTTQPPARRCVFPVCTPQFGGSSGGTVLYTTQWWNLLKSAVSWSVYGQVR